MVSDMKNLKICLWSQKIRQKKTLNSLEMIEWKSYGEDEIRLEKMVSF